MYVAKAAEEPGQIIAIAVEIKHDRMARLGRHVPDDDLLAIRGRQDMFFGLGKPAALGAVRPLAGSETASRAARNKARQDRRDSAIDARATSHFRTVMSLLVRGLTAP